MQNLGCANFSAAIFVGLLMLFPVLPQNNGGSSSQSGNASSQTTPFSSQQTTTTTTTTTGNSQSNSSSAQPNTGNASTPQSNASGTSSAVGASAGTSDYTPQSANGGTGEYTGLDGKNGNSTSSANELNPAKNNLEAALAALEEAQELLKQVDSSQTKNRDRAAAATANAIRHTQAAIADVSSSK